MKYFTVERNKISNTYKATEVSIRRFEAFAGFRFPLLDEMVCSSILQVHNGRIVVVNF